MDGEITGNVSSVDGQSSTLVLSENARIEGAVSVSHMIINGTVVGPVTTSEFLELQPRARVTGDVAYSSVEIHLGAIVEGRLVHNSAAKGIELKLAASK